MADQMPENAGKATTNKPSTTVWGCAWKLLVGIGVIGGVWAFFGLPPLMHLWQSADGTFDWPGKKPEKLKIVVRGTLIKGSADVGFSWGKPDRWGNQMLYTGGLATARGEIVHPLHGDFFVRGDRRRVTFDTHDQSAAFYDMGPTQLVLVTEAPKYRNWFGGRQYSQANTLQLYVGHVYCFALQGGDYFGKLLVTALTLDGDNGKVSFTYVLQTDKGSRSLVFPEE